MGHREQTGRERFILAIDGGGMRGVIPSYFLSRFSDLLIAEGDTRPLADHFDLIAGTSTGSIIALALTCPGEKSALGTDGAPPSYAYKPVKQSLLGRLLRRPVQFHEIGILPPSADLKRIGTLYKEYGREIFPKRQSMLFGSLFIDKYDSAPFEDFLQEMFRDVPLSEAVVPVLAVSYDISGAGRPFLFTSDDDHQFRFWEAARASSAAPTYFRPAFFIDRQTGENLVLVDGGVVANNPVIYAYAQARKLYPDCPKFHILSLSTGRADMNLQISKNTGVIGWLDPSQGAPIQKILNAAQDQTAATFAQNNPDIDYTRVGRSLKNTYKMDVTTDEAIASMEEEASEMFQEKQDELVKYAKRLSARTEFDQLELLPLSSQPLALEAKNDAPQTTSA
jgi:patatin-like phospholipase/acyl hydrolase